MKFLLSVFSASLLALAWALPGKSCAQVIPDRSRGPVQGHGFAFEDWVRNHFFPGAPSPVYTAMWDIPASANTLHGGIPVNPKATQYGQAVGLGDALRQYDIDETFLLIIGFWRKESGRHRCIKVISPVITPEQWKDFWRPITRADLEALDAVIKDRSLSPEEARRRASEIKSRPPFTEAVITVNPKIDSKTQRRLQCSISFSRLFEQLSVDPAPDETASLFGVPVPEF